MPDETNLLHARGSPGNTFSKPRFLSGASPDLFVRSTRDGCCRSRFRFFSNQSADFRNRAIDCVELFVALFEHRHKFVEDAGRVICSAENHVHIINARLIRCGVALPNTQRILGVLCARASRRNFHGFRSSRSIGTSLARPESSHRTVIKAPWRIASTRPTWLGS